MNLSSGHEPVSAVNHSFEHDPIRQRMTCATDGVISVLDYTLSGTLMTITHTGVPTALRGRGIAAQLTRFAPGVARDQGWRVRPVCSYADAYIRAHAEYQDLLA
jgi:predicted GNAT family acetyltransferase